MQKAAITLLFGTLALAACAPGVPNSAAQGVGFSTPETLAAQRAQRDAALSTARGPDALAISDEALGTNPNEVPGSTLVTNNPGISDEQSFDAVAERETIESDAERLARQRAAYEVIPPEPLPDRSRVTGPNIVAFALSTTNRVGEPVYSRGNTSASRHERACARYASPGLAQEDFLASGGPDRDRKGLDPDGDGFACDWDPTPFRAAAG